MIAIDGGGVPSSRGIYSGPVGGAGSNGGPNITAASFAAAAAAAAAASNGSNSTVPAMMLPGASTATAATSVQQQQESGVTWGEMMRNRKEYTLFKKLVQLLQDNRLKSGDEEAAEKLRELNRSQNESFPVLKSILNAIFITTGVVLLIAVVVVIIYTSIVKGEDESVTTATISSHSSGIDATKDSAGLHPDLPKRLPDDSSLPSITPQGNLQNDGSSNHPDARGAKICRTVAIEQEGENLVRLVPMCFHTSLSTGNDRPG